MQHVGALQSTDREGAGRIAGVGGGPGGNPASTTRPATSAVSRAVTVTVCPGGRDACQFVEQAPTRRWWAAGWATRSQESGWLSGFGGLTGVFE